MSDRASSVFGAFDAHKAVPPTAQPAPPLPPPAQPPATVAPIPPTSTAPGRKQTTIYTDAHTLARVQRFARRDLDLGRAHSVGAVYHRLVCLGIALLDHYGTDAVPPTEEIASYIAHITGTLR